MDAPEALALELYKKGLAYFQNLRGRYPDNPRVLHYLGVFARRADQPQLAYDALRSITRIEDLDPPLNVYVPWNFALAAVDLTVTLSAAPTVKYDAAYSVCKAVVPVNHKDFALANDIGPASAVMYYFMSRGEEFDLKTWTVEVAEGPKHGVLVPYPDEPISFNYRPEDSYLGPDQITFVVKAQGKLFKVIETAWVADVAPEYGGCPADYKLPSADSGSNKGGALDILELPADGPLDAGALAKLHSMVFFSMRSGILGEGALPKIADLSGGGIGQTLVEGVNASITLYQPLLLRIQRSSAKKL